MSDIFEDFQKEMKFIPKKKYSFIKQIVLLVIIICVTGVGFFFLWKLGNKVNYKFQYRSMVEDTIKNIVKKECLKEK